MSDTLKLVADIYGIAAISIAVVGLFVSGMQADEEAAVVALMCAIAWPALVAGGVVIGIPVLIYHAGLWVSEHRSNARRRAAQQEGQG